MCYWTNCLKYFNPVQDGLFRGCSQMGGSLKMAPLPKICRTYPTMIQLGTVIPYLKRTKKHIKHVTHPFSLLTSAFFYWKAATFLYQRIQI